MSRWNTQVTGGVVASSAVPPQSGRGADNFDARGLLVRGVVIAVYVSDGEPAFPDSVDPDHNIIFADVLISSTRAGMRGGIIRRVSCGSGGVHGGRVWKPRAATNTFSGRPIDATTDALDLDGDFLLVGFIDGDLGQPTMVRQLDHPRRGTKDPDGLALGQRDTLVLADGQPDLWKHHGSFFGIDDAGDFVVDTRRAHGGTYDDNGAEVPDAGANHGNMRVLMDPSSTVTIVGVKADGTGEAFRFTLGAAGTTLQIDGVDAVVPVARANHLQALYTALKTALELYGPHVHPSAMGPTGTPVPPLVVPDWMSAIASDHAFVPDEQP